jgi:membrane-associated HD superfamily phosphohydrolase
MFDLSGIKVWLDVAVILIPVIVALILIWKLVLPRHPKLGVGLIAGVGLIGGYFVQRKLKKAFAVEDKLAEFNEDFARFKETQKRRQEAVSANQEVIRVLQKKQEKLAKHADRYETELKLIDAELQDREKLNKQLLEDASSFVAGAMARSKERQKLIGALPDEQEAEPAEPNAPIEIDGYHLFRE